MKNKLKLVLVCQLLLSTSLFAAEIVIESPKEGEKLKSPVIVKFAAKGVEIVPAGEDKGEQLSGHYHLIVNGDLPDLDKPLGTEVIHYGKGQTQTELELEPGQHSLQLILGDKVHKPHTPAIYSRKINIEVLE